ncbi:MAG: FtsW/RodA/SpoVE family cell cycle protein [Acidimicrobiales bacterium]|nr:FtsW/RodA/SpoVE family cell cycle protein [Acidimicrobiales bacterium]
MTFPAVRNNAGTGFSLLLVAAVIVGSAYALAGLGETASLPANILPFLLVFFGLMALAYSAMRTLAPNAEPTLVPIVALLNGLGYVVIARLDRDLAANQATWTAVGVVAFVATLFLVKRAADLERYRYLLALGGIGLLLAPLLPVIGTTKNGARLWLQLGPFSFQPGELAKIALAVFFASYLVERRELLTPGGLPGEALAARARAIGPLLGMWGVSLVVMIAERDLGSSSLFFALFVTMLWVAAGGWQWPAIGFGLFGAGSLFAINAFTHVRQRIDIWLDPWEKASSDGFQLVQASFAFAAGGVVGTGLAKGAPQKIPAVATDLIFAAIGEELGLVGAASVIAAFALVVVIGLRIATRAERPFEQLLAVGLTAILGVQSCLIIGGVTRLVPLTGITLPFVSYGGSSIIANWILIALLLRISSGDRLTTPTRLGKTT